jgi:hypothetical protein
MPLEHDHVDYTENDTAYNVDDIGQDIISTEKN